VTDTDPMTQATKTNGIDRLPCGYVYCFSYWIGKSVSGLCPCCRHRGVRLSMVHVFSSFWINAWHKVIYGSWWSIHDRQTDRRSLRSRSPQLITPFRVQLGSNLYSCWYEAVGCTITSKSASYYLIVWGIRWVVNW